MNQIEDYPCPECRNSTHLRHYCPRCETTWGRFGGLQETPTVDTGNLCAVNTTFQDMSRPTRPGPPIELSYVNWRGECRRRIIEPLYIRFGSTLFHPVAQWLLVARDPEDGDVKEFSLGTCDFRLIGHVFGPRTPEELTVQIQRKATNVPTTPL
jgi:hypothetical protein